MNRFHLIYRRTLAVLGGAAIGLLGAFALASPASAHHSEVAGSPYCDVETGEWVVTWQVDSFAPPGVTHYKLTEVHLAPEGSEVSEIAVTEGDEYPHEVSSPLIGEQRLPGDTESASLAVRAEWSNGYGEDGNKLRRADVVFEGICEQLPEPGIAHTSDCDSLTIEVTNPFEDLTLEASITVGELTELLTLDPQTVGEVSFNAASGTVAIVTINQDSQEINWEQPADCDEPAAPGDGGELPVTGSQTGIVIGASLALLALGGGLFLVARRRRITFTA